MKYSVVIATHNRAPVLRGTLRSLAALRPDGPWEVVVVDNNSTDDTGEVVRAAAAGFPVELRYVVEAQPGRSPALNAGIRLARGGIIVTTDDDVRVPVDWLDQAAHALEAYRADYVGGRVLPIWGAPRPRWLPERGGGRMWAVVALLDYGDAPFQFGTRVPLGVNMAFRRAAFDRAGLLDPDTGRRAGTLLGQEIREWCIRAGRAGVIGFYAPRMVLEHIIPAERLTRAYFRRWFYWRGVSRALLYARAGLDMETPEQATLDFSKVPHVFGVPRYLFRTAATALAACVWLIARGQRDRAFERELWLWFFAGILRQRAADAGSRPAPLPTAVPGA